LVGSSGSGWKSNDAIALSPVLEDPSGSSADSLPTRSSAPKYNYHGLAASQTQNQYEDIAEPSDSQKENTPSSGEIKMGSLLIQQPVSPNEPLPKVLPAVPHAAHKVNLSKTVPFQSPRATTAGYKNATFAKYPSPPPYDDGGSQDSFAGPISQDPEKQFLATTRLFNVPLSELGKASTQDATASDMFAQHVPSFGALGQNRDHGRILVAATPSQSGSSQSPSAASQHSQDQDAPQHGHFPGNSGHSQLGMVQTQNSSEDDISLPSSSYERLIAGERGPTQKETQPADYQATQPADLEATQPSDLTDAQTDEDTENAWISPLVPATTHSTTVTTGNPRSILSMVNPMKKWRLQGLAQQLADNQIRRENVGQPSSATVEATQVHPFTPSNPNEVVPETPGCSKGDEEAETQLVDHFASKSRLPEAEVEVEPLRGRYRRAFPPGHEDPMDVVPDSDPPAPSSVRKTPTKRKFSEIALSEEGDSGEIVPDSLEDERDDEGDAEGNEGKQEVNQEEDEDDVPLAALAKRGKADKPKQVAAQSKEKGKGKARMDMAPPAPVAKVVSLSDGPFCTDQQQTMCQGRKTRDAQSGQSTKDKGKQKALDTDITARVTRGRGKATQKKSRGVENADVPSSVPAQDNASVGPSTRRKAAGKGQINPRSRSASTASRKNKKRRVISASDDELRLKTDEEGVVPGADEDEGTEPIEEQDVDIKPNTFGRKPKRATTRTSKNGTSRASTLTGTPGPSRIPSVVSMSRITFAPPTRVFALWKGDLHYYAGTIDRLVAGNRYVVNFDDESNDTIELSNMRRCELMLGDSIILSQSDQRAKVAAVDGEYFRIPSGSAGELDDTDYQVSDIRIAPRSISAQWGKRGLRQDSIVTKQGFQAQITHSTNTEVLRGIGLFISMSAGIERWREIKKNMKSFIIRHGGTVIEDFLDVISIPGRLKKRGRRWVGYKKNIAWVGADHIKRIFLLSDDANEKSKYLISLALGIPCLYPAWLESVTEHDPSKVISCYCERHASLLIDTHTLRAIWNSSHSCSLRDIRLYTKRKFHSSWTSVGVIRMTIFQE
jgi:hypothetical protein